MILVKKQKKLRDEENVCILDNWENHLQSRIKENYKYLITIELFNFPLAFNILVVEN